VARSGAAAHRQRNGVVARSGGSGEWYGRHSVDHGQQTSIDQQEKTMTANDGFQIDLSDLEIEDIQVLMQEGGRGMPEFAASSCHVCGSCSCIQSEPVIEGTRNDR
jgi:hypothetical protein